MDIVQTIADLFAKRGGSLYGGEEVTQQAHALQAALLAEQAGADDQLVAAALLHDIGHLLHDLPEDAPDNGIDDRHEELGQLWLAKHFGPAVTEPVRLHVAAKRYLCAAENDYLASLRPTSVQSLELQGGPFSVEQRQEFERSPYFREATELRRWDDKAKVVGLQTPDVRHYLITVERIAVEKSLGK